MPTRPNESLSDPGDCPPVPLLAALPADAEPTSRQLHRDVWRLAWPSVTTMLLQTFNSLMDVLFVGHLPNSRQALAATGVGGQIIFLLISLAMGVSVGTTALVARFTGAQDHDESVKATGQSLALSALLGALSFVVFYSGRDIVVGWLLGGTENGEAARLCSQFLGIALLASVPLFLLNVLIGTFRGLGDTRTPMKIQVGMIAVHIGCNVLLIYGLLGFPKMGVRGAATALALSICVGVLLYLAALVRCTPLGASLRAPQLRLRLEWVWRILRIGAPAAVQAIMRTVSMMSFTGMLARTLDGAAGVAALQIGMRAEALAFMPGFGYSVAASALVGQSLGARDPKRAERYGWAANLQGVIVMSAMAMLFFTLAVPISQSFAKDPLVQRLGTEYLRINAFCEPFIALGIVLTGALQGAGDTIRPAYITIFTMWFLRLPLAYWLMFVCRLQSRGAWLSMCATTIVGGLMTTALFRSGKWKRIKV